MIESARERRARKILTHSLWGKIVEVWGVQERGTPIAQRCKDWKRSTVIIESEVLTCKHVQSTALDALDFYKCNIIYKYTLLYIYIHIYYVYVYIYIYYTILYYIILYYIILYYIILYYIILCYIISYYIILNYIILYCIILYYIYVFINTYYIERHMPNAACLDGPRSHQGNWASRVALRNSWPPSFATASGRSSCLNPRLMSSWAACKVWSSPCLECLSKIAGFLRKPAICTIHIYIYK